MLVMNELNNSFVIYRRIMIRLKTSQIPSIKAQILKKQKNLCILCQRDLTLLKPVDIVLDHDHKTGLIRSVLCRNCNAVEGKVLRLLTRGKASNSIGDYGRRLLDYWTYWSENSREIFHPTHRTDDERRLLKNKRARLKRKKKKEM